MASHTHFPISRRNCLALSGTIAGMTLAGCAGSTDEEDATPDPADLEVLKVSISEQDIKEGDTVEVTAIVTNTGEQRETFSVELSVDGDVVENTEVTISPGEEQTVTFSQDFSDQGEFEIGVNALSVGMVTVNELPGHLQKQQYDDELHLANLASNVEVQLDTEVERYEMRGDTGRIVYVSRAIDFQDLGNEIVTITATYAVEIEKGWKAERLDVAALDQFGVAFEFHIEREWIVMWFEDQITEDEIMSKIWGTVG